MEQPITKFVYQRIIREVLHEATRKFNPVAIQAMYDLGKQDNEEGDLARTTYERVTGKKWVANAVVAQSPAPSKPRASNNQETKDHLRAILDAFDKVIQMGNAETFDKKSSSRRVTVEQENIINQILNKYNTVLTRTHIDFLDSLDEDDYRAVSLFFEVLPLRIKKELIYRGSSLHRNMSEIMDIIHEYTDRP